MKLLDANEVSITTASVDIQVMRIGTKQMTIAVFRQLPRREIFDKAGNLIGHPWGWVNYDRNGFPHKPYVFSYQGILYRDDVEDRSDLMVTEEIDRKWDDRYHRIESPSGRWRISIPQNDEFPERYHIRLWFDSERSARLYLTNWLAGVALLKTAPQLFIAV